MASFSSSSVCVAAFLLLSIVLVSASTHQKTVISYVLPSSAVGAGECGQPGDSSTETTIISSNCADCTNWCNEECADTNSDVVENKCAIGESKYARRCKCCCREKAAPPPSPADQCRQQGDTPKDTTRPTANCGECTTWCKQQCSAMGASVVDDKCSIPGQSAWLRKCDCCCRDNSKPPPQPSCGCAPDVTLTTPGSKPCNYKLVSSLSSSSSS
ncbi:hypothetical protein C5167_025974 [Papaver somniferum]|uniref:Bowman-Birk serine protease inhibitors family domain-containing protein n=1 Tax=Papaver somniferum TaxID=3469 RepID=A0A4Y7JU28_PAPSO|nr:uncharacterized protein LOC113284630 isoform X1 [Papaver somniferum]RZC64207.1 hypothetical protein C5167_025974 [Papaver somniferum]